MPPWDNQTGGNGGGWRGGGGPWGQPPRGGGSQPPDLEELLRRGQDRLRRVFPGGGGNRGTNSLIIGIVLLGIVALWLYQSFYVVDADEVGVELLFGEAKRTTNAAGEEIAMVSEPGIHFMWWPFERVEIIPALRVNQENIGFLGGTASGDGAIMLTSDQNLVDVQFTVLWRIADPIAYLFNVADQQDIVRSVSESVMREYVGRTTAAEFRTTGRELAADTVEADVQSVLNAYRSGIEITSLNIERADPPAPVAAAFEEVQRAQQDQQRFRQEALVYANQVLGQSRGQAAEIRLAAEGYRSRVIAEARGQAQRFLSILTEYWAEPETTLRRLYLETMEDVFGNSEVLILDSAAGALPLLDLGSFNRATNATGGTP